MCVILDALYGELGPVARLLVLHVEPERRGDAVDDPDIRKRPRAVDIVVLIVIDLEVYPQVFCDPGQIACVFSAYLRDHFNHITGIGVDNVFLDDTELVVIQVRGAAEVVVGKIGSEEGIVLRAIGYAPDAFVFGKISPEVAVGERVRVDQEADVLQVGRALENNEDLVCLGIGLLAVLRKYSRAFAAAFVEKDHYCLGLSVERLGTHFMDFFVDFSAGNCIGIRRLQCPT
jgi:hypothetical protein